MMIASILLLLQCIHVVWCIASTASGMTSFSSITTTATATGDPSLSSSSHRDDNFLTHLQKNLRIVYRGSTTCLSDFMRANKIKQRSKKLGLPSISFTDYNFLERSKADISKCFRLLITIPLSPEFFFYSYMIFPILSANNPWAWRALPSSFDDVSDAIVREQAIVKRRVQTVVISLHTLKTDTLDDVGNSKLVSSRKKQLDIIGRALQQTSLAKALDELSPWLLSEGNKASKLSVGQVPGLIIKQCCRSVGLDGVPNLPVVRRLNIGELNGYLEKLRSSDTFLETKGLSGLSLDEIKMACFERCISATVQCYAECSNLTLHTSVAVSTVGVYRRRSATSSSSVET